ncbi:hypothetical protein MZD04_gp339 [Pseudomonas phage Psa21]|uniref:Uncharacterized protein n=1 Tax=Pseudomonas phage Psa21 TaxID=2530023 RepID=A0A481W5T6_9CAUD|nr:hypothetical protein MZD04_gp339 [Pseudomonas phage Psa21]QBJ02865.1 hypothetical protein PSA21_339 [Pseudomonas phage Psa21]
MSNANANMLAIRGKMVEDLVEMNQNVQEVLDNKDLGFTIEQSVAVKKAIEETTYETLRVIDARAQIFPSGHNLGEMPFFDEGELTIAYIKAINT